MSETSYARRGDGEIDEGIPAGHGAVTGEARVGTAPNIFGGTGRGVDHFTAPEFREHQREAIEEIDAAFQQGYRFVFLNAPTGSGKSVIGRAIAFEAGNTHILTGQKLLQDQYCLAPGTRLLTGDLQWVPIESLSEGDELLGFDEERNPNRRNWRPSKVLKSEMIVRPCYRLKFSDGSTIVASDDHKWLTGNGHNLSGWISTKDMRAGYHSRSTKIHKMINPWEAEWSAGLAYLSAAFDGEGHLYQKDLGNGADVNLVFTQRENPFLRQVIVTLESEGFSYRVNDHSSNGCKSVSISGRAEILRFLGRSRPVRLLEKLDLNVLGMINPIQGRVSLVEKEFLGERTVVALSTDTRTFIAEGFASHNCNEFPDMFIMKGRSEYKSKWEVDPDTGEPLNTTCANCPCQRKRAYKLASCPYGEAKKAAERAPVTVHNFDSFYYQGYLSHAFSPRQLMIIDEAHNLEEKFLNFMEFTLSSYGRPELTIPEYSDIDDYDRLVRNELEYVRRQIRTLDAVRGGDQFGLEPDQVRELEDMTRLEHRLGRYVLNRDRGGSVEYVFEYEDKGAYQRVTFRPVFVGSFVRESLFPMAQRFLMMSATLLDKDLFARSIGASPDEVYFIDLPSTFPAKNRPIVFRPVGSMKYSERENTLPMLAAEVQAILDRYPDRRGIIQTHNEKTAKYLRSVLKDERLTFNKDFSSPQEMLEVHRKKPGSFIVASGLREGLDLSGDLSKVQVFCKVPYPSLGDKRVKRKMDIDKNWYGYMTTLMFVQALGRSVRSKSEKAITYLLDSDFKKFYGMNKRFIPKYIREAIVWR